MLKIDFKEVGPFAKLGKNLNAIGRMLNNIHFIDGGEVLSTKDFIRLKSNGTSQASFTGTAYVAGAKTTGLSSDIEKAWVKCDAGTGSASEVYAAEVVFPFPPNTEYYEKAYTYGDIHLPRL
jgi:hypothetical protein